MAITEEDIHNRVYYHQINQQGVTLISEIREETAKWANLVRIHVPEGREQSLAITGIEQAQFWAVAGIARHPDYQAEEGESWREHK